MDMTASNTTTDKQRTPKTVSASEAKNRFGTLLGWVLTNKNEVIVKSHGEPKVVMMSFTEYEKLKELQEEQRRRDALARLEQVRERVRARNQDVSEQEAEELADRFVRDVVDDMVKEGKITFK